MKLLLAGFAVVLATSPAAASGGFWCDVDDASISFHFGAGLERGGKNSMFNASGDLEIRATSVPAEYRRLHFGDDDISQKWLDADDLKLALSRDLGEVIIGYLTFEVETRAIDEGEYAGTYLLVVSPPKVDNEIRLTGKVSCGAE